MNPARWEQIQAVFHRAITLSQSEQAVFLTTSCNGDGAMLRELSRMIEENSRGDSILDRGLPDVAYRMIGSPFASLAGSEIGVYRLLRLIGEGGMGVVYLAERTDTGKQVAMKFLSAAGMSPARRSLFTHEIRTHAKLSHPCIAAQYDAGVLADGTPWFVMEFVPGKDFLEYCQTHHSSLADRLKMFVEVCHALEYLHGKGIVHRDLKPSNILVDESGTPRVLDFGIAEEMNPSDGTETRTRPELQMMTRAYAAPEWIERGVVDNSTDVFSLGVIFYQLLTGQRPPVGDLKVIGIIPAVGKTAWRELEKICRKALQADSTQRYQSVEALRRDINHFLKNEPLEEVGPAHWYRLERFVTRHRPAVVAAVLATFFFAGMAAFFTIRLAEQRNVALAEVKRTKLVEQFLFDLFQGGDKAAGTAADLRVLTLIGRGEREAKALNREPQLQAEFYQVLGGIYQELGQLDKADALLNASFKQRSAAGSGAGEMAETLLALASLRLDQARFPDASRIAGQALDLRKSQSPPDELAMAKAQSMLGRVWIEQARYEKAIVLLKQAQQVQSRHEEAQADLALTLVALSDAYFDLSNYPMAESWAQQSLSLHQKLHGPNHPLDAIDLRNLGNIQTQTTHYVQAEKYLRDALSIQEAWYGEKHPETADTQIELALALQWQGRLPEAQRLLEMALPTMEQAYGEIHPRVALVLNQLGMLTFQQGKWLDSEKYDTQAAEMYSRIYGPEHQDTTIARNNLASVYVKLGQYARAEQIFSEVIDILVRTHLGDSLNAGITRLKLGRALTRQRRYREAEVQLREGCAIVTKNAGPSAQWVLAVRPDLQTIQKALGQPPNASY